MKNISTKFVAAALAITLATSANFASAQNRRGDAASEASALSALPIASVIIVGGADTFTGEVNEQGLFLARFDRSPGVP